jgi:hypothetical protein
MDLRRQISRRSAKLSVDGELRRRSQRHSKLSSILEPGRPKSPLATVPSPTSQGEGDSNLDSDTAEVHSFNWDLNPSGNPEDDDGDLDDAANAYKKQSGRRRCNWIHVTYKHLPFALQCFLAAFLGDCLIFACLGLPDLIFSNEKYLSRPRPLQEWTSNVNVGGMPLLIWAGYLMISYSLHWLTRYILGVAPFLLQRSLVLAVGNYYEETLESWLSYLRAMHGHLTFAAWALLSNVLWNLLIGKNKLVEWQWQKDYITSLDLDPKAPKVTLWWEYVSLVLIAILIASIAWSAKKFFVCFIVSRYQRTAFSMRIKRMRFASDILRALKRVDPVRPKGGIKREMVSPDLAKSNQYSISVAVEGNNHSRESTGNAGITSKPTLKSRGAARIRALFARKAQRIAREIGHTLLNPEILRAAKHIPPTVTDASHLARNLFHKLVHHGQANLRWQNFESLFDTTIDAKRAFRLFDKDGNGDVSKQEFRDIITGLVKEKQNLEDSMQDASSAVGSLEGLFSFIALCVIFFFVSQVFSLNINFASLLALVVPLSFMFGSTAKDLFEALIFLFVYQSFAVGDRCEFKLL